jgi:hypothetical protein
MKKKIFQFTKSKVLLTLIFFVIIFYLVGIPVENPCFFPNCVKTASFQKPDFLFSGNLELVEWVQFVMLVVSEVIISYMISCLIVYLHKKHKRHRK